MTIMSAITKKGSVHETVNEYYNVGEPAPVAATDIAPVAETAKSKRPAGQSGRRAGRQHSGGAEVDRRAQVVAVLEAAPSYEKKYSLFIFG